MTDSDYIKLILSTGTDISSRLNSAIEEILRRKNGQETVTKLVDSLKYTIDEMETKLNLYNKTEQK